MKVCDARPWTPKLRTEQEAASLVWFLFGQGQSQSGVFRSISDHQTITDLVRRRALEFAKSWRVESR